MVKIKFSKKWKMVDKRVRVENKRVLFIIVVFLAMLINSVALAQDSQLKKQGWKRYYPKHRDFSILFPDTPTEKKQKFKKGKGFATAYFYQSCLWDCTIAYTVTYSDFGKDAHLSKYPETSLDWARDSVIKNTNGQLLFESHIDYKGHPGREIKIEIDTHQGKHIMIERVYLILIENKVYEMNVSTPVKYQFMPEHYKFLDSFKIE